MKESRRLEGERRARKAGASRWANALQPYEVRAAPRAESTARRTWPGLPAIFAEWSEGANGEHEQEFAKFRRRIPSSDTIGGGAIFIKGDDEMHNDDNAQETAKYDQADNVPHLQRTAHDAPLRHGGEGGPGGRTAKAATPPGT